MEAQALCVSAAGAACARVLDHPAMSPPFVRGSGRTGPAFFHCEVVGETFSAVHSPQLIETQGARRGSRGGSHVDHIKSDPNDLCLCT